MAVKTPYNPPVNLGAEVARVRAGIADLKQAIRRLDSAPMPLEEAKRRVDEALDRMADKYDLQGRIGRAFSPTGHPPAGELFRQWDSLVPGNDSAVTDLGPVLAALFHDLIRERLHGLLEKQAATMEAGPAPEERRKQRADLERRLFEAEVEEERLIERAEAEGIEIYRRADVNPAAVIGIF